MKQSIYAQVMKYCKICSIFKVSKDEKSKCQYKFIYIQLGCYTKD